MSFKLLAGQHELRHALSGALVDNKMGHAVLLAGPPGIGKKCWGKSLAQAILCPCRSDAEPCGQCNSCLQFSSGNHPDYFTVCPDGRSIKIEQLRSLRRFFYLSGSKKVCLIEQAEMMTAEACSSLLKILEEPPAGLHFILLADQPQLLFDTILSRCRRYNLQPLAQEEIRELLVKQKGIDDEKAQLLARLSGGLPGYALDLEDDSEFKKRYEEAKTLAFNLATSRDSAHQLLSWAAYLADRGDLIAFLELFCLFYRDGLVGRLCRSENMVTWPIQQSAWADRTSLAELENVILLINKTVFELTATNANRRLLLEKMLILIQRRLTACPR